MEIIPTILLIVAMLVREWAYRKEMREERLINAKQTQDLLQRITAPEMAAVSHATGEPHVPINGVPLMEDAEYQMLIDHNAGNAS